MSKARKILIEVVRARREKNKYMKNNRETRIGAEIDHGRKEQLRMEKRRKRQQVS